ncbi:MAG: MotA/TolQ/ExbB proton channel family protein, partial [bacterium]
MLKIINRKTIAANLSTFLIALPATAITFALVYFFAPEGSYTHEIFLNRSWIQYASVLCFWSVMGTLYIKQKKFSFEKEAIQEGQRLIEENFAERTPTYIWADADRVRDEFVSEKYGNSIIFNRIVRGLDRLRKTQSTNAFGEYFHTRSDIDAEELESGYTGIRYLIWLIPTLGFIGTVMGISLALQGFSGIIARAADFKAVRDALPEVTYYLATAFDTTFLALGLSVVAVFYMSYLLKREEQLLEQVDNLCFDGIIPLFQEHSRDADKIVSANNDNTNTIIKNANGNRAALENAIRNQLPTLLKDEFAPLLENLL